MMVIRAACIIAALSAAAPNHVRAEIPIGFSSALTGPYAWLSEHSLAGTELAIADLNAKGGVLGEPLEPIVVDDGCNAELAPLAAEKLVSAAVAVVISVTCSGAAIPASKVYRRAGIPMIEAGATNPKLTQAGEGGVFRIVGRDDLQGTIGGDYLVDRWGNSNIAIVHDTSTYGKGLAEEVQKRLNQRGVSEVLFIAYAPGAMDFSDLLGQLSAASIEVLYVGGYSPEAGLIIRQARDRKYSVQLVAGNSLSTGEFWLVAGPAGEGALFTSFSDPTHEPRAAEIMGALKGNFSSPMHARSTATQPCSCGRRQLRRPAPLNPGRSPRCCMPTNSTPSSAPSASTRRATSPATSPSCGMSGGKATTLRLTRLS